MYARSPLDDARPATRKRAAFFFKNDVYLRLTSEMSVHSSSQSVNWGTVSLRQCADKQEKKCWDFVSSTLFSFTTNCTPILAITHSRPSFFSMYVFNRGVLSLGWRLGFLDMLRWESASSSWFKKTSESNELSPSDDKLLPVGVEPQTECTVRWGFCFSLHSAQEDFIHQTMWRSLF